MSEYRQVLNTLEVDSVGDYQFIQARTAGTLMVCLCDIDGSEIGSGPIPYAELCAKHDNAVKLESLVKAGLGVCLHVTDADGNIVPVTREAK